MIIIINSQFKNSLLIIKSMTKIIKLKSKLKLKSQLSNEYEDMRIHTPINNLNKISYEKHTKYFFVLKQTQWNVWTYQNNRYLGLWKH